STSPATAAMSPATVQTGRPAAPVAASIIGKPRAGAARQLHSRAVAGLALQGALAGRTSAMQVLDKKHYFPAQKFSNPIDGAPLLSWAAGDRQLSTKLSTAAVDDLGCRRHGPGAAIRPGRRRARRDLAPRHNPRAPDIIAAAEAASGKAPFAFDNTSGRMADLAIADLLDRGPGPRHRAAG
ncbi:MAG: hypothetical protein ACXWIZ_09920, partial [Caldimonas sp.]